MNGDGSHETLFSPEFSSLSVHIALLEAGIAFETAEVGLTAKRLGDGSSYLVINPKGLVPVLQFDDGTVLTENVAILSYIADRSPNVAPAGQHRRYLMLEMLSFIASEIHKRFPVYLALPEGAREAIGDDIVRWFGFLAPSIEGGYLFGKAFSPADAYLFVMARGALALEFPLAKPYHAYVAHIDARPSAKLALSRERANQKA